MQTMQWIAADKIVPALCIAAIAGAALYSLLAPPPAAPELDALIGRRAALEGVIVRDPDVREKTARLTLETDVGRILVVADRLVDVRYGDRVRATGTLEKPEPFETDSDRTFNYPMYLRAHGIGHEMSFASVAVLAREEGNPVVTLLLSVKHALIRGIEAALPEPESALLAGLLLGEKQSLGDKVTDAFRKAGVVHIIVLSGYNVALVIQWVLFVALRILPRIAGYTVAALFVVAFAVMTGGSETTIRASIMALLMIIATVMRRPGAALHGLLIASATMALWNPFIVLFDLSFQLSVLATLGLILFSDKIARCLQSIPQWKYLPFREIVATTIATQATVLPLLVLSIGAVSLVFLPANALVLPAVPFAMLIGFFAATLALVSTTLAFPLSVVAYALLTYIINVAVFFGSLPFASVSL